MTEYIHRTSQFNFSLKVQLVNCMTVSVTVCVSVCECDFSVSLLTRIVGMEYLSFNIKLLQFSWGCVGGDRG